MEKVYPVPLDISLAVDGGVLITKIIRPISCVPESAEEGSKVKSKLCVFLVLKR